MAQKYNYKKFFPFEKIREEQSRAIDFALDAFLAQDKRFVVCALGTGIGKSAIGVTIGQFLTNEAQKIASGDEPEFQFGTYILTVQKMLQDQYIADFKKQKMCSIKSSANYKCNFFPHQSCAESLRVLNNMRATLKDTPFEKSCTKNCTYRNEKLDFVNGELGITNFAYFFAETMYAGTIVPRELLICDEAHSLESELSKFIELAISANFAETVLELEIPDIKNAKQLFDWLASDYKSALTKLIEALAKQLGIKVGKLTKNKKKQIEQINDPALAALTKRYEAMDKHCCKLNRFLGIFSEKNWVVNFEEDLTGGKHFRLKPIDVAPFAEDHLFKFGKKVLLMSATIVDNETFCRSVGIPLAETAFIEIDSPFPVKNRPIHYMPVGKMNASEIDKVLPNIVEAVKGILALHPNSKGMIHCVNFKIANYLNKNILNSRLLFHKNSEDKVRIMKEHITTSDPTVLVSPSMIEGVDLKDDLSRFQIFCKIPFPYLGDEVTKKRMERDPSWYSVATARSIIQASGRSVRNIDDTATTYILDSCFEDFLKRNKKLFPKSFLDALQ